MAGLTDILSRAAVMASLKAASRAEVFASLAAALRADGLDPHQVLESVIERERLGSTGVGDGVAVPHGRIHGIERTYGAFAQLAKPIDYDSIDGVPVDLVFLLVSPNSAGGDHLKALARVSRILRRAETRTALRNAPNADALHMILSQSAVSSNAA